MIDLTGWISLHRKIQEHWLWEERPFSKGQAWIDILLLVNHEDGKVFMDGELIEVYRGEHITSEPKLAKRWGWSRTKVRNFLDLLEKEGMIKNIKEGRKRTRLRVLNYNVYQDNLNNRKTTEKQEKDNRKTTEEQQKNINNNDNNENNNTVCMYSENLKKIVSLLEQNIGIIPPVLIDEINEYLNIFSVDMFREAIKIAANRKKRHVNYVLGVLRQWKDNNIITINDLEALRREKELEKEQRAQEKDNKQYTKPKNRFHNFEQRTSKYTAEELEEIAKRKREEYYKKVVLGGNQDDK